MADDFLNFCGVDVAPGGLESLMRLGGPQKGPKSGDDFAIFCWRWKEGARPEPLYAERHCGISAPMQSARIHRLHQEHHFITIMCDPQAGGIELYRNVRSPKQIDVDETSFDVKPLITENDEQITGIGEPAWAFFSRGEIKIFGKGEVPGVCPRYPSDSVLILQMHTVFQEAIKKKFIQLPPIWPGWKEEMRYGCNDATQMRTWLNEHPGFTGPERSRAEIDLAIQQLIQIERENDKDGKPIIDKYNAYSYISRSKKDLAYAMLYGYFALWCFIESNKREKDDGGEEGDVVLSFNEVMG
jgi:hypothetical protein